MRVRSGEEGYSLLIVEDEALVASALRRRFRAMAPIVAPTVGEAMEIAESPTVLCGAIVDFLLPDGRGLEVIPALRRKDRGLPILLLTATFDRDLVDAAQRLGVEYLVKPATAENFLVFGRRIVARLETRAASLLKAINTYAARHRFTECERNIVTLVVRGVPRAQIHTKLEVSENTVKTQVRTLLAKCGCQDIDQVARDVFNEALAA